MSKVKKSLKPCPFCGSAGKIVKVGSQYFPRCAGNRKRMCLLARAPVLGHDGFYYEKDAIDLWEMRVE